MRENSKRQHPASLHASGEDYLEAILILHMKKGTVRSVDVARHLGVSKPSVCHAVALLKDGGFLTMPDGCGPGGRGEHLRAPLFFYREADCRRG